MRDFYEYDDPNGELLRRLERDEEKEPRQRFALPPRRKQFRYWSGLMFRPSRDTFSAREISSPVECSRVDGQAKRGGRYEPTDVSNAHRIDARPVDAPAKRAVNNWTIFDGNNPLRSRVGSSQRCASLGREA
jgi:hypothetical protein